jgi:hypothetical protein
LTECEFFRTAQGSCRRSFAVETALGCLLDATIIEGMVRMNTKNISVRSIAVVTFALASLGASSASAQRTYLDRSTVTTDITYYIGNANNVPSICASHGVGNESIAGFSWTSSMQADWEFDLSTANTGGPHHVTVVFIRDGMNEPAANNDCGYNAAAWTDLNFGGHYLVIHTGEGGDFISGPGGAGDVYVYTHGGADTLQLWYHAGTYDGGADADSIFSQWVGDHTTGGELLYGGSGYDSLCDLNGVASHAECGTDYGASNYATQPFDCNATPICSYPSYPPIW